MAKPRKSKASNKKSSKPRSRRSSSARLLEARIEDQIDGCDFQVADGEITPDAALPPAKGGVEMARVARGRRAQRRASR